MPDLKTFPISAFSDYDVFLFKQGRHFSLYEKLGAHLVSQDGHPGVRFALWAPSAYSVHVIGDFNQWNDQEHPLFPRWDSSGIWEGFIPHLKPGMLYKFAIRLTPDRPPIYKGDPFAFFCETPPKTASVIYDVNFGLKNPFHKIGASHALPMSIYEMHLGSWKKKSSHESLSYLELAKELPPYLVDMGFTHVEFMPVMEHPFFGSWGYQKTGYFAPSSRYGTPEEFSILIRSLHSFGIKIILDWVPSHFPSDEHGLAQFDGTYLYEHQDPRLGFHPDWKSAIFNYGRHEILSFLISSASFWIEKYGIDGLRVDAVSSMLYLDYSRKKNEWIPNVFGGNENLDAMEFLKLLNTYLYHRFPHIDMIAEESTAWPMVSRPTSAGGLGFGYKWNMGWMHDTLKYFSKDPIHRKWEHSQLLFSMCYFFHENFILSLSHDEVVYGKGSLLAKMPGDAWQRFANLRLLYSYMFTHPGKKLLFMGSELGQSSEWNHDGCLQWELLEFSYHQGIQKVIKSLNHLYKSYPAFYLFDHDPKGFEWVHLHDSDQSVIAFLRKGCASDPVCLVISNFTPVVRTNYLLHSWISGKWELIFNSDDEKFQGSNFPVKKYLESVEAPFLHKIVVDLPPLATLVYLHL